MDNQFIICKNCGGPIKPGDMFCGGCGAPAASGPSLREAAAQEKTVLYLPEEDDSAEQKSAQWQDRYDNQKPVDSYKNIASYTQPEQPQYPSYSQSEYARQNTGGQSDGYSDYSRQSFDPPTYYPPEPQPGQFDYVTPPSSGYSQQPEEYYPQQQDDYYPQQSDDYYPQQQEDYYPPQTNYTDPSGAGSGTQGKDKVKKILTIVLIVTVIILLIEGVFAVLYLTDVTSSFFPVEDVVSWIKGEDKEEEQEPEENTTQFYGGYGQQDYTPPVYTAPAAPETTTAANVPDNLQPYLANATAVNGLYYVNTRSGNLNLRKLPSGTSAVLAEIPKQTVVTVQYTYDSWGFVEYRGQSGWVSMQYLAVYN